MNQIKYVSEDYCMPCKAFWPVVSEVCGRLNVSVSKISTESPDVAGMGITSIPTILYYKNGSLVRQTKGAMSKQQFESLVSSLL